MDVWEVPYSSCPPALTKASSWMSDLSTLGIWVCTRRSNGPRKERYGSAARVTCWPDAQAQQWAGRVSDESGKSLPAPAGCCSDRSGIVAEPVLETCRAKARIIAGGEALIVHRIAVVERLGIGDYRPWVPGCVRESPHEVVLADRFGTGQFDGAIQRLAQRHGEGPPWHQVRLHPPPHRCPPHVHAAAFAASSLFLIITYLYQPRPGALGPLPRCGAAPPHLLRASRSTSRASGARGAARANDIHRAWHRPSGCTRATCRRRDGVEVAPVCLGSALRYETVRNRRLPEGRA